MRRAMTAAAVLLAAVGVATALPAGADDGDAVADTAIDPPMSIAAATTPGERDPQCMGDRYIRKSTDAADAVDLMNGKLTLTAFRTWNLPHNPSWKENPYSNDVWAFDYQTMRWADVLRREGLRTDNQAMLDRYAYLLWDYLQDNAYLSKSPRSEFAWHAMVVGVRAIGLVCAADALDEPGWVRAAMTTHAKALLDPKQRGRANHALHQDMGLLALGCREDNQDWSRRAVQRASDDFTELVNSEGVAREGSLQYQMLDHRWYLVLQARMLACGLAPDPAVFLRLKLMPDFIGHATQPDGHVVAWGDTSMQKAPKVTDSLTEYVLSQGVAGPLPNKTFAVFPQSGYAFSRSGWFDTQTANEQSLVSVRFGPAMSTMPHAHEDAGAVSFYAAGKQILWQPGLYAYGQGIQRTYVRSNEAHNVIDIAGVAYDRDKGASLTESKHTSSYDLVGVRTSALKGADWKRTVVHFKEQNILLVDDRVSQSTSRTVHQNWQFGADRSVKTGDAYASTSGSGSDATIVWAGTDPSVKVAKGRTNPLLGWRSEKTNSMVKAPTVQASKSGKDVRLTAIVVPTATSQTVKVLRTATHESSRTVDVQIGSKKYRIVFTAANASITPL